MMSVAESSSFLWMQNMRMQTIFGREEPISATDFSPLRPIFAPDQIFHDMLKK